MTRNDFVVGQTVYLKTISHLFDSWKKERIVKGVVSKISRKYITVKEGGWEYRFNIENDFRQETEYAIEYELFLTEQAVYFENGKVEECNAIITYEQPVEIRWDKEVF